MNAGPIASSPLGERYALSALRKQGCNQAAIARARLGRCRSTISREVDGTRITLDPGRAYRPDLADGYTAPGRRRGRSRRNERFGACESERSTLRASSNSGALEQAAGWSTA